MADLEEDTLAVKSINLIEIHIWEDVVTVVISDVPFLTTSGFPTN